MDESILLNPDQAATLLNIGRTRMFALIKTGEIPSCLIGKSRRIRRQTLEAYASKLEDETRIVGEDSGVD